MFCVFLRVFLLTSFIFIPPMGYMWKYTLVRQLKIEEYIQSFDALKTCLDCCVQRTVSKQCDACKNSVPCEVNETLTLQQFNNNEIKEILKKHMVLSTNDNSLMEVWQHDGNLKTMDKEIIQPELPFAHLLANDQPEKVQDTERGWVMKSWKWSPLSGWSFTDPESMYDDQTGVLTIPRNGLYKVYAHTTFFSTKENNNKTRCSISQQVKRQWKVQSQSPNDGESILSSQEVVQCDLPVGYHRDRPGYGKSNVGFHTLSSVGTYKLLSGDRLWLYIEKPEYVKVATYDTETYFGVFMI